MNLNYLSDEELHNDTKQIAQTERKILTRLLHHLREVERRRLFSKLKYESLYDYVMQELKYSEDQATYRIAAMRLMRDVPQIEAKIEAGTLSLTNAVIAKTLFNKEHKAGRKLSKEQKLEVVSQLENKSMRTARKIVSAINPEMAVKKPAMDFDSIDDEGLKEKLIQVKGLYAHSHPNISLKELLHLLCDRELEKKSKSPLNSRANLTSTGGSQAEIRRQVWKRDGGKCCNCESTHAIQVEHRIPQAAGGPSTLENMCLLCRSCNQRAAIEYFGMQKMGKYLKSPVTTYATARSPSPVTAYASVRARPLSPDL